MVCTGETKSGLAWTYTKPTLNPTNTHTPISISAEGEQEFNSYLRTDSISTNLKSSLCNGPTQRKVTSNISSSLYFSSEAFLQESTEYHTTLKAKTFL